MENKNQSRNIDPQKIRAENLNGRFALVGLIALVGAYITTGQIVPGVIQKYSSLISSRCLVMQYEKLRVIRQKALTSSKKNGKTY